MTSGEWAVLLGALGAFVTALTPLIVALRGLGRKVEAAKVAVAEKVDAVKVLVDGQRTELVERVDQLTASLKTSDTPVPPPAPPSNHAGDLTGLQRGRGDEGYTTGATILGVLIAIVCIIIIAKFLTVR